MSTTDYRDRQTIETDCTRRPNWIEDETR